jgi:acetoacetyl-CoA synthetase
MRLLGIGCPDSYRALRPERNGAGTHLRSLPMEPKLLWRPSAERVEQATIARFARAVGHEGDYDELWRWSVDDLEGFWAAIWEFFDVHASEPYESVLGRRDMPGAQWFPGSRLSYAEHFFRDRDDEAVAIRHASELRELSQWNWGELREQTARIAAGLRRMGVGPGDRVAAYMPNIPETIAAFLATASIGAVWSSAAPEFGARSVVDRFAQIEPTVLLAVDGYRYGGRDHDRGEVVAGIAEEIGARVVRFGYLDGGGWPEDFVAHDEPLTFQQVPFEHPLWLLYSSGTTGLPKPIVHSQGGILLEHLKYMHLHVDAQEGDRVFWFTTTGWMMWNFLVGVLLTPASIVLFDGNPGSPDLGVLWDLAEATGMTTFGTSASYIASCMKAGVEPREGRDLSALRAVGSTGSPLAPEGFDWVYEHVGPDTWLFSTSGGTDLCTAFVGGVPTLPVYEGELQARALGAKVEAFDEDGNALVGEVGELVLTEPMPSMPISFWGDDDGSRLRESYFEMYPGVWRHGDWIEITERGTAIITGRSDSTINRGGIRMGTSEIYSAVLADDDVVDALVVDVDRSPTHPDGWMPLFVVLREGEALDDDLVARIKKRIREDCSPRHVPNEIHQIDEVPRTLSGKALEVPVKRILMGHPPDKAASRESLANPDALDYFVELADGD